MEENPKTKEAANSSKGPVKSAADDLKAGASAKTEEIRLAAEKEAEEVPEAAQSKAREFSGMAESALAKAKTWHSKGEGYFRENPTKSIFIALGLGFFVGLMFRK
jgi:ElaB/YqjD/DUF883 family membrane-anchored ribosome-binding protein